MPKQKPSQPELIREERAEYIVTPEEQTRKEAYRQRLKEFLEDPASRQIEGFPIGEIDDILALSDPPYYTACPNPFLAEIIQQWTEERKESNRKSSTPAPRASAGVENRKYHREPFATDVSEGKNDPIYNAHSYHTKVPHKAIMRYILHYTEPGDIVFDGFCGTGMTGVAAQLCGDKKTIESLSYRVTGDGKIYEGNKFISQLGARKVVLNDLSPAATFIAYNYNTPVDIAAFEREARRILDEFETDNKWMYETLHIDGKTKGRINFVVWSDILLCASCGHDIVFWNAMFDINTKLRISKDRIICPNCKADQSARRLSRMMQKTNDIALDTIVSFAKQVPVLINYTVGSRKFEKVPSEYDIEVLEQVEHHGERLSKVWFPSSEMLSGLRQTKDAYHTRGLIRVHHFYWYRTLQAFATLWEKVLETPLGVRPRLMFWLQSVALGFTKLNRYFESSYSQVNRYLKGMIYAPPISAEIRPGYALEGKIKNLKKLGYQIPNCIITSTGSCSKISLPESCVDYIFVDPPFGRNLMYGELNFIWESWLRIITNRTQEAIIDETLSKQLSDYYSVMRACFQEMFRILKPGRWITIEFHNSQNAVWQVIQESLGNVGFVIADVRTLDKQLITMQQWVGTNVVDTDLVISAYKPNDNLEERFRLEAGTNDGAWDFVRYHLTQLPRVVEKKDEIEVVAERQSFLLFDRMVAFHIQRGASVPLSAGEFYAGLQQKFVERDGMYFLPDQVAEYDSARLRLGKVAQLSFLVNDEKTAIQWLRQQLDPALRGEPQSFSDLQPKFMRGSSQAKHEQMPELGVILEQNFLEDKDGNWYIPDPNKATDLERLRLKALLREFNEYVQSTGRLKQFRTEAVRAGFADAYKQREYKVILDVAARLPESVLHEDPDLLMYFDTATLRAEQNN